jgi:Glycosyltransferase family 87
VRDHGPALAFAAFGVWAMSFLTLYGFGWNDYGTEAAPAYDALTSGHLWRFLELAPGYGGSLELRAPFAFIPGLWGGGAIAVYQAVSIPCLVAAAVLAVWLAARMRDLGQGTLARATAVGLCVANPVTLYALQNGHPEELLGAVLCVAAVLAAQRGHAAPAGLLLGLAVANKQWALLAIGPVLIALPAHRGRAAAIAAAVAACFYVPLWLPAYVGSSSSGSSGGAFAGASGGTIFQPWQLWWFLGSHGHVVRGAFGDLKLGYRTPPVWLQSIDHPLIVALGVPLTALAARRRRSTDAMLLLALVLAVRFAFDTWDTVYYPLPFIFALLAWESLARRRPPVLSLAASIVVWLVFIVAPEHLSADAQSALFLAAAVPAIVALALAVFAPRARPLRTMGIRLRRRSSALAGAPISTV